MLNVLPQLTGLLVARHVKISYSAGLDLAYIAFWNGLRIERDASNWPGEHDRRLLFLRTSGLTIRLERAHDSIEMWILRDGRAPKVVRDFRDMREVLDKVRDTAESYQRHHQAWWAVVPADKYRYTKFNWW